jgi:hypothetical protein
MPSTTREVFAHDAVLDMAVDADERSPGGAITVALCGSWSHEPPCPLAPHHTRTHRVDRYVTLRLLFAADPGDEARVRLLVDDVLGRGWGDVENGGRTTWQLLESGPSEVLPEEVDHVGRLVRS